MYWLRTGCTALLGLGEDSAAIATTIARSAEPLFPRIVMFRRKELPYASPENDATRRDVGRGREREREVQAYSLQLFLSEWGAIASTIDWFTFSPLFPSPRPGPGGWVVCFMCLFWERGFSDLALSS